MMKIAGKYFYGNEISRYGQDNGYVDYATLAKAFDAVLNNEIIEKTADIGYWEIESGFPDNSDRLEIIAERLEEIKNQMEDAESMEEIAEIEKERDALEEKKEELENEEDSLPDVYQWYIVSESGAEILERIGEIVYYNEALNMYVWGVTHYGTSWSYVLTNIPCNCGAAAYA